jgi:hypothetical protein
MLRHRLENERRGGIAFLFPSEKYPTSLGWQGTGRLKVEELQTHEKINKQE